MKDFSYEANPIPNPPYLVTNLPKEVAGIQGEMVKLHEKILRCEGRLCLFKELSDRRIGTAEIEGFLGSS